MEVFIYLSVVLTRGKYNPYMTEKGDSCKATSEFIATTGSRGDAILLTPLIRIE